MLGSCGNFYLSVRLVEFKDSGENVNSGDLDGHGADQINFDSMEVGGDRKSANLPHTVEHRVNIGENKYNSSRYNRIHIRLIQRLITDSI